MDLSGPSIDVKLKERKKDHNHENAESSKDMQGHPTEIQKSCCQV
jgi:hypothetical protein